MGPSLRHVSPFYFMFLAYFVGGAPRAASSPSRSGQTQWHVPLLRLFSGHAFDPSCLLFDACPRHLFFLHVGRLHVKGGVPEHRDSWAPTGSPALTLWFCPWHRDLAYQRWLRPARGPGPEDIECRHLTKFAGTHHKIRPSARRNPPRGRAP